MRKGHKPCAILHLPHKLQMYLQARFQIHSFLSISSITQPTTFPLLLELHQQSQEAPCSHPVRYPFPAAKLVIVLRCQSHPIILLLHILQRHLDLTEVSLCPSRPDTIWLLPSAPGAALIPPQGPCPCFLPHPKASRFSRGC